MDSPCELSYIHFVSNLISLTFLRELLLICVSLSLRWIRFLRGGRISASAPARRRQIHATSTCPCTCLRRLSAHDRRRSRRRSRRRRSRHHPRARATSTSRTTTSTSFGWGTFPMRCTRTSFGGSSKSMESKGSYRCGSWTGRRACSPVAS